MIATLRLDRPLWPLLLVLLSPLVTAPTTGGIIALLPDCGVDEPWWRAGHVQMALLPGLIDALALLWLASRRPRVRRAALAAGLVGLARIAIAQASISIYAVWSGGQASDPACTVSSFFLAAGLVPLMAILWLVSAMLIAVVLCRASGKPDEPSLAC